MDLNLYDKIIIDKLGFIPEVQGNYDIFNNKSLEIDSRDLFYFEKLFSNTINSNYGDGELALYWLLKNQGIKFGGNGKDLEINSTSLEVKKYLDKKIIKIGRIPVSQSKYLVELQKYLFEIGEDLLIYHLDKKNFQNILKKDICLPKFKNIVLNITINTLKKKIGNGGYLINFRSKNKADIYKIDINSIKTNFESIINSINFTEMCLFIELDKFFTNEIN
jgi:hypothetical protein